MRLSIALVLGVIAGLALWSMPGCGDEITNVYETTDVTFEVPAATLCPEILPDTCSPCEDPVVIIETCDCDSDSDSDSDSSSEDSSDG